MTPYRYKLTRVAGMQGGYPGWILLVMLNPSTADEENDDPTVRRGIWFATREHYPLFVGNLYGWRATHPKDLFAATDPVGPDNDDALRTMAVGAAMIIVAWGATPAPGKAERIKAVIDGPLAGRELLCLGKTADGSPRHPMARGRSYVPDDYPLEIWRPGVPCRVCEAKPVNGSGAYCSNECAAIFAGGAA